MGKPWSTPVHYYLISEKASFSKLKKDLKGVEDFFLRYTFIRECIAAGSLLPIDKFKITAESETLTKVDKKIDILPVVPQHLLRKEEPQLEI